MAVIQVSSGIQVTEFLNFEMEICCNCAVPFMMPVYLIKQCRADSSKWFCCPNGHSQHYSKSESTRLREQLESEKLKHQKEKDELTNKMLDAISERQKADAKLKRVHNGVCPCCNRTFTNLARHMKTKHPKEIK